MHFATNLWDIANKLFANIASAPRIQSFWGRTDGCYFLMRRRVRSSTVGCVAMDDFR